MYAKALLNIVTSVSEPSLFGGLLYPTRKGRPGASRLRTLLVRRAIVRSRCWRRLPRSLRTLLVRRAIVQKLARFRVHQGLRTLLVRRAIVHQCEHAEECGRLRTLLVRRAIVLSSVHDGVFYCLRTLLVRRAIVRKTSPCSSRSKSQNPPCSEGYCTIPAWCIGLA